MNNKRFFLCLLIICILLCGCTPIQDMSLEDVIKNGSERTVVVYNKYRKGYKYNLPKGLDVIDSSEYNEIIASKDYKYYLYIDAVSYFNKVIEEYEVSDESYKSMPINFEDKYGYLEINELKNEKYLIEIMYNYAKIEVIVNDEDINVVVANAMSILTSIYFNDNVLKTLLDEEVSQFKEFDFNIFETKSTSISNDSEYLQATKDDVYDDNKDVHDFDLID